MFKTTTIHANTCIQTTTPLRCHDDGVVQQPLAQQTFFQLLHVMDLRTVDPLLKDTPYTVYTGLKYGELDGHICGGINSWRLSLCSMVTHSHAR